MRGVVWLYVRSLMKSLKLEPPKSRARLVCERLRDAIIDGGFALGSMIPEETLAQSFGVSRTPVREALNLLQIQGLVVIRPQVGSFVFSPSVADIEALCRFRMILEPRAAELAFAHDRAGVVEALEGAVAAMEAAVGAGDTVAYGRADTAFHDSIVARSGNAYVEEAYRLVASRVAALRTNLSSPVDVMTPRSYQEHRRLLDLFDSGDFAAYEALMTAHIQGSGRTYVTALERLPESRPG